MAIETRFPDSCSKEDLLSWLMVVVCAGSLQLSAPSIIASVATSPRAKYFRGQFICNDWWTQGRKGLAISGQYETTWRGYFSFRAMLGSPSLLLGPAMQPDFSFIQSWCLLSPRCVYNKVPSHKTSIVKQPQNHFWRTHWCPRLLWGFKKAVVNVKLFQLKEVLIDTLAHSLFTVPVSQRSKMSCSKDLKIVCLIKHFLKLEHSISL